MSRFIWFVAGMLASVVLMFAFVLLVSVEKSRGLGWK